MSNYTTIPLTRGYETIIDAIDADLAQYKWSAHKEGRRNRIYARSQIKINDKWIDTRLHRVILERILDRPLVKGEIAEHKNNDPLDNRRDNIRLANNSQNAMNKSVNQNSKTGVKGVSWVEKRKSYKVGICVNKKYIFLGEFKTLELAAQAYAEASKKYHGDFGRTE